MKIYYVKMLIFTFLISTLVSPHNENYQNNHYNVSFIQNNTKWTTIKSRLLAQTQKHNPHYHNDPELKGIIDKLNALTTALKATSTCTSAAAADVVTPATTAAVGAFPPYGIAALVLLILAVVLIILYIWLYRRRKNSYKHECKKHLCK
ncbi:stevor PIR protein, putative [Plasmodium reichenowi]|uniref:Stevor PIR protein, putative n=1 Tax=Plasmodium reichenowi TaxID=5854 RepID=A0A2P9DCF5_PLARE|nr:stevor PIR protein, putative [Plasmodium reichenowi]